MKKLTLVLFQKIVAKIMKKKRQKQTLDYMPNTSAAILMEAPTGGRVLIYLSAITVFIFILWAYFAKIDVTVRGSGQVVPASRIQIIQNLEGGIISDILVHEGEQVSQAQPLIKLDNTLFRTSYRENEKEYKSLLATNARLEAEINDKPLTFFDQEYLNQNDIQHETALYKNRQHSLKTELAIAHEQANQTKQQLHELHSKQQYLSHSLSLSSRELALTRPLSKEGAISEVDLLRLEQRVNELKGDLEASKLATPRLVSAIQAAEQKEKEILLQYQQKAINEQKSIQLRMGKLDEIMTAHQDRVNRTLVRSPVAGTVKKIHFSTLGGVVQPGRDLLEVVPFQDQLLIEAKIQPKDIAFLRPGLPAVVKITAYDFATHGSIKGVVEHISADSIFDDQTRDKKSYYIVRVRTEKNHLTTPDKPIIPGMTASIDVITNKRSVLASILKPILRAKEQALRER